MGEEEMKWETGGPFSSPSQSQQVEFFSSSLYLLAPFQSD